MSSSRTSSFRRESDFERWLDRPPYPGIDEVVAFAQEMAPCVFRGPCPSPPGYDDWVRELTAALVEHGYSWNEWADSLTCSHGFSIVEIRALPRS